MTAIGHLVNSDGHRLITTQRDGVTTSNVLDAAGNTLEVWRYGRSGGPWKLSK